MILVYGATGYTGRLVSQALAARKVPMIVAGRRRDAVCEWAAHVGAEARVFPLDDVGRGLQGVTAVLNCAGPFARTAPPLVAACLAHRVHYLDLAGEVPEHEATRARGDEAHARGVMLLPGVGFGVVPTEAAAVLAARKVDAPARLVIAYETVGGASRGTLETVLRGLHHDGVQRKGGALVPAAPASKVLDVDLGFARGDARVVTNPWRADLVAAYASTGAPDIETYATFPAPARALMRSPRLMESGVVRRTIDALLARAPEGPSPAARAKGRTRVLAIAENARGERAEVRVHGPDAYDFTARAAAAVGERIALAKPGYQTPARVFGPELLAAIEGVEVVS